METLPWSAEGEEKAVEVIPPSGDRKIAVAPGEVYLLRTKAQRESRAVKRCLATTALEQSCEVRVQAKKDEL